MKISEHFTLITLLVLVSALSCEEVVTPPEIEGIEDLLVVNALIGQADSIYQVEVSWTRPSFGVLPDFRDTYVENAEVILSDGDITRSFAYDKDTQAYILRANEFPIADGTTYQLRVMANGQEVSATATTTERTPEASFEFLDNTSISVRWQDLINSEDHYRLEVLAFRQEESLARFISFFFDVNFISDSNRNGTVLEQTGNSFDKVLTGDTLSISIFRYDELYVDYFEILDNFLGDDPFSEPVQLPTNIEGGLGIFSIFQQSHLIVEMP